MRLPELDFVDRDKDSLYSNLGGIEGPAVGRPSQAVRWLLPRLQHRFVTNQCDVFEAFRDFANPYRKYESSADLLPFSHQQYLFEKRVGESAFVQKVRQYWALALLYRLGCICIEQEEKLDRSETDRLLLD